MNEYYKLYFPKETNADSLMYIYIYIYIHQLPT